MCLPYGYLGARHKQSLGPSEQDTSLIDNGAIDVAPPTAQKVEANPLPCHATGPSGSFVNMVSMEELPIDPLQLTAPPNAKIRVHIMKRKTPLVVPVNYSSANLFIIGCPAFVSSQSLSQNMATLTISSGPWLATKPVFITGGSGCQQVSEVSSVNRI